MINLKISFYNAGTLEPYHKNHPFDPNNPPIDYGQAIQISLRLGDLSFDEDIPMGAKPFFKVRRRKDGNSEPRTIGYKVGYQIAGYRKYVFIDVATGETQTYSDKI